jgi:hypothetical protein
MQIRIIPDQCAGKTKSSLKVILENLDWKRTIAFDWVSQTGDLIPM